MKIKLLRILLAGVFVFGLFSMAQAAKPQNSGSGKDVIAMSNGFPSGLHFNLNVHGKDDDYNCNQTVGGHSVFIPLYNNEGDKSEIQYVSNKKSNSTELMVIDSCSNDFTTPPDDDPIKVFLPQKVWPDEELDSINADGYFVFARILAKPNNGRKEECGDGVNCSNIILYPNSVVEACNDSGEVPVEGDPTFGEYTDCDGELALGLIVGNNLYEADPETEQYVRFDPTSDGGKGKSKATDITRFFTYTGWVVDETLDTAEPYGTIDINDVPLGDYDDNFITDPNRDYNADGNIDELDVEDWLTDTAALDMAWSFDKEWILNIADLVVIEQKLVNDGTKLLQIRFYPVSTTEYVVPQ
jgi:hypothetical protein